MRLRLDRSQLKLSFLLMVKCLLYIATFSCPVHQLLSGRHFERFSSSPSPVFHRSIVQDSRSSSTASTFALAVFVSQVYIVHYLSCRVDNLRLGPLRETRLRPQKTQPGTLSLPRPTREFGHLFCILRIQNILLLKGNLTKFYKQNKAGVNLRSVRDMIGKSRIALASLLGFILATLGLVYLINLEQLQRKTMEWLLVLSPNTMMTNLWQHPSLPMTAYIYIFNWTNSEEMNNPLVKPRFEELGPYTFNEQIQKLNVTWNTENSTVSYLRKSRFTYVPELSKGNLSDVVITPNTLTVGLTHKAKRWNPMLRSLMMIAMNMVGNDATFERTVNEWLFEGFDTPLVKMSSMVPSQLLPQMHFPYERIGYGYPRNGSTEIYGHHNIYTGADDFSKIGQIARWRYDDVAASFPHCKLKGSIGEFHPTPLKKGESISYFLPDICRELQVDYAGTTIFEGIEAFVYKGSKRNMANGTDNPDNSCYCQDDCKEVRSGVMNVSGCWYDVPVFASYPHFYNADPYYADAVDGLKPDKDRHEMVIILEPKTGMLLSIKATIMISLLVEPHPEGAFRNARRNFLPLAWADYRVNISSDLLFYLKLLPISTTVGKIFGILLIVIGLTLLLYYPRKICMQRHLMTQIDITSLENRIQATASASPELKNYEAEGSPLLVGLQYVATSVDAECVS